MPDVQAGFKKAKEHEMLLLMRIIEKAKEYIKEKSVCASFIIESPLIFFNHVKLWNVPRKMAIPEHFIVLTI